MSVLEQFVLIIFLGTIAQWVAWRIKIPSILLLLALGVLFGPVLGIINPEQIFAHLLMPLVAFSLAIILFEGGLNLRFSELKKSGSVIFNLIIVSTMVSWLLNTMAALWILKFNLTLALLLGALMVVTGPTVILPMLRLIKPTNRVASILKWEGIVNDPLGAVLSVLVFEAALTSGLKAVGSLFLIGILKTIFIGGGLGLVVALVLIWLLKKHLIPDFLQNSVVMMSVVLAFACSNHFQSESGLLAVTVLGILLGNQRVAPIQHVIDFKESLQVILIACLFVTMSARLNLEEIRTVQYEGILFVIFLIFVSRPISVFVGTIKQSLTWRERLLIAFMAPRGIVAGAVSVVFALELANHGIEDAGRLVPITFMVIMGTVTFYGLLSKPLAVFLKLACPNPQGLLILGCHRWGRTLAKILQREGIEVILVDSNQSHVNKARLAGLIAYNGNILAESFLEKMSLSNIGYFLALTENDNVNTLSTLHTSYIFNRSAVFQLAPDKFVSDKEAAVKFKARVLFQENLTYTSFTSCLRNGGQIKKIHLSDEFPFTAFTEYHGASAIALFILDKNGRVQIISTDQKSNPQSGDILFYLNLPPH
jgi:NhaP-type Na+/H+ or K+/H+ antiporter